MTSPAPPCAAMRFPTARATVSHLARLELPKRWVSQLGLLAAFLALGLLFGLWIGNPILGLLAAVSLYLAATRLHEDDWPAMPPKENDRLTEDQLAELKAWIKEQGDQLTVFHEPLMLDAPETWVPRRK